MTGNNIVMEQGWELAPPGDYVIELEVQQITEWIKSANQGLAEVRGQPVRSGQYTGPGYFSNKYCTIVTHFTSLDH